MMKSFVRSLKSNIQGCLRYLYGYFSSDCFNAYKCLYVRQVIAYYDYQKSTIRHVQCPLQITEVGPTKRCTYFKNHCDKVVSVDI